MTDNNASAEAWPRFASILTRIQRTRGCLRRSEQKVAEFVLQNPSSVVSLSIAALAHAIGVSEPTVIRFCRAIQCDGFQDFKLRLAGSLAHGVPYVSESVDAGDSMVEVAGKVLDRSMAVLLDVRHRLDTEALEEAVGLLAKARRVEFYGHGASGVVAADAQQKFFRLGISAIAYSDPHLHSMSAATLGADSVVFAISHTGRSVDLLESVAVARQSGASVIGLTARASPLACRCTLSLGVDVMEDTDHYTPMLSRIAHLVIIDALAVGVALRRGPDLTPTLERVKGTLRDKRLRLFGESAKDQDSTDPFTKP